ncbi:MAG TPA: choice-of-anchor D domain-containing protein [Streptosporangiaceae bacterium]|nr:choice-of-anchor D domain-containing protein [Streptosporangiaceae bacterium]
MPATSATHTRPVSAGARLARAHRLTAALALAVAGLTLPALTAAVHPQKARADVVTASGNNLRDGWDSHEPNLSPTVLKSGSFGQLFSTKVDGQVFAEPIVAGPTVIAATMNDWVYGLNAVTGAVNWKLSLGAPFPTSTIKCDDATPNTGVMGTPVYDPSTGTVYVVAEVVPAGNDAFHPAFFLHALNAKTGAERPGWPVQIKGSPVNAPTKQFSAISEWQRPGLLLLNGNVYAGFGSHCDWDPFTGYVAGVNTKTKAESIWSDESGLTDTEGGIWQSGGGLMSDGTGRIFVATGNGISPPAGPGNKPPGQLADAVVRLAVGAGGTLSAKDFFSPGNAPTLDATDGDLGSGAPVGLPFGTNAAPHLLVQAGKDARVFLLNRDGLGGRKQGPKGADKVVAMAGPYRGEWGHPAAFGNTTRVTTSNVAKSADYIYFVGTGEDAPGSPMQVLRFGVNGSGHATLSDVTHTPGVFGFSSGSPVVTSNGTAVASAVVWEVSSTGNYGTGTLEAFRAVPSASCTAAKSCALPQLWSAPLGAAAKFTIPATSNGRVYVGTADRIDGFGSPHSGPLTGTAPVSFGQVAVGTTSKVKNIKVKATGAVTVRSVNARVGTGQNPFITGTVTKGGKSVKFPVKLAKGDTLTVPVSVKPTAPGGATGSVNFATSAANFPVVSVALSATGTKPGFYAKPGSLAFDPIPAGTSESDNVVIINGGAAAETVSSVTPPGAPFTVTGLPGNGDVIQPGASVTATVKYAPTGVSTDSSQIEIDAGDSTALTIDLSGTGQADNSQVTPSPNSISFGSVPVGTQATKTIQLTNAGNLPATITTTSTPPEPFGHPMPVPANLPFNPGYVLNVPVTFSPPGPGAVSGTYSFAFTDATGTHEVAVPVSGTGTDPTAGTASVPPPGGGWTFNGSAQMSGTDAKLTSGSPSQAGSVVYDVPQPSDGLLANFTTSLAGAGGDGLTFALLDATSAHTSDLGSTGDGLGWAGDSGVAVALVTHSAGGEPASPFVGIATGSSGGVPTFAATSTTNVPSNLSGGPHNVQVSVSGQQITVDIDGQQALQTTLPPGTIPASVLPAFTAGADGTNDNIQSISDVGVNSIPPPGGGWHYNGTAGMFGSDNQLTAAVTNEAGTIIFPQAVKTVGLDASFDLQFSGGNNGYGITFALLDPKTPDTSIGANGPSLGFGGLTGVAAVMGTKLVKGYPSSNFVGAADQVSGNVLLLQSSNRNLELLRTGTHVFRVHVTSAKVLQIWMDGELVIQQPEPTLTSTALLAFTAANGSDGFETHVVRDIAIATQAP